MNEKNNIKYWRSIQYREWTDDYRNLTKNEFRRGDSEFTNIQRRDMLKLMGASFMLAGLGFGCRRPVDKIIPYNAQKEPFTPGVPKYFATTMPNPWGDIGIVVETHEGRPTKIEGNKLHPASLGSAGIHEQAAILELYDPDRTRFPVQKINDIFLEKKWEDWDLFAENYFKALLEKKGKGCALLCPISNSPTMVRLKKEIAKKFPNMRFYIHDPLDLRNTRSGCEEIFGNGTRVSYSPENAKVILTIHSDFLTNGPMSLVYARGFAAGRKIYNTSDIHKMNRLYSVEANFSMTGTNADHRFPVQINQTEDFLLNLAYEMFPKKYKAFSDIIKNSYPQFNFIKTIAADLIKNKGQSLIVAGEILSSQSHALIHSLNCDLEGFGKTFHVLNTLHDSSPEENVLLNAGNINDLVSSMNRSEINDLIIINTNPIYSTPYELKFKEALKKVSTVIHCGTYRDESADKSHWHLPLSHFLESWGDARSYDGTASLIQPMISPLHNSRSAIELLSQMLDENYKFSKSGLNIVKDTWEKKNIDFDKALHDGIIPGTKYFVLPKITPRKNHFKKLETRYKKDIIELILDFDSKVLDGRFSNLSWLQELADPVTKIAWGNVVLISQALAIEMGIKSRVKDRSYRADIVSFTIKGVVLELPAFIMPGLADRSVIINLGYGRKNLGAVANDVGVDCFKIMPLDWSRTIYGVELKKTNKIENVATTQEQFAINGEAISEISTLSLSGRDPAKVETIYEFENKKQAESHNLDQLTDAWQYTGNKWGMVIDLSSCIGCNACVIACQSENNIPVVGKEEVMRSRSMQWIRVDRYFTGDVKNPLSAAQPVPCMHCENAPCEPVCPVAATVHDSEGLNTMVYNRCVGTRYCGNNCPYKVRRFNYFDYTNSADLYINPIEKDRNILLQMQKNPDVTIRYRGVMEKCTYCTQRIQEAKIAAKRQGKDSNNLPDGSVIPACAQTCPTGAIVFGNMNDNSSNVNLIKNSDRNYDLLGELNVRPRTSYLKKLRNPNLELE